MLWAGFINELRQITGDFWSEEILVQATDFEYVELGQDKFQGYTSYWSLRKLAIKLLFDVFCNINLVSVHDMALGS